MTTNYGIFMLSLVRHYYACNASSVSTVTAKLEGSGNFVTFVRQTYTRDKRLEYRD